MQQNASGGRYINEMGVLGIVGKNPDASLLEIENVCPCTDKSAACLLQSRSRGCNYWS